MPSTESNALSDLFETVGKRFPEDMEPFTVRCLYDLVQNLGSEVPGLSYEDVSIPTGSHTIPAKWLRPANAATDRVILYLHGGGYMFGSLNSHRKLAAHLAAATGCLGLMIDYRLSPTHKFPAAHDDCFSAYRWLLEAQGIQPGHIAIAGDSCGGNLASGTALRAKAEGIPLPGAVVSLSPWYNLDNETATFKTNEQVDKLNKKEDVDALARMYVGGTGVDLKDPRVSAMYADLTGISPHWISVGGYDMLLESGERFAALLNKAGVEVNLQKQDQMQHVSEFMAGLAPEADRSISNIGAWTKTKLGI